MRKLTAALALVAALLPLGAVHALEIDTATPIRTFERPATEGDVSDICWTPDGQYLAASSEKVTVYTWDANTGEQKERITHGPPAGRVYVSCVRAYPQAPIMVHCSEFGIKFNLIGRHGRIPTLNIDLKGTCWSLDFSPNGDYMVTADKAGDIKVWNLWTNEIHRKFERLPKLISMVAYAPDGDHFAAACEDGKLRVYAVTDNKLLYEAEGDAESCTNVAWSKDGKWLAAGGHDKKIRLIDAASGKVAATLEGAADHIFGLAFYPEKGSPLLASATKDGKVTLWDVAEKKVVQTWAESAAINGLAWRPDGKALAVAPGKTIKVLAVKGSGAASSAPAAGGAGAIPESGPRPFQLAVVPPAGDDVVDVLLAVEQKGVVNARCAVTAADGKGEVVLTLKQGEKEMKLESPENVTAARKDDMTTAKPGDLCGKRLHLTRYFGKLDAGKYSLHVAYRNAVKDAWTGETSADATFELASAVETATDTAKTPFTITVHAPASGPAGGPLVTDIYLAARQQVGLNARFGVSDADDTKGEIALALKGADGKEIKPTIESKPKDFAKRDDFQGLSARDIIGTRIDLARFFPKLEAGEYTLVVTYHNSSSTSGAIFNGSQDAAPVKLTIGK